MEVYGLAGPSGTGKSTKALSLAYENDIPAIIDDGLLIFYGKNLAGRSAKFEKNKIAAIKRATFYYQEHAEEVKKAIQVNMINKILILGTSYRMIDMITSKLQFGEVDHYLDIEKVSSNSEIKLALFIRKTKGNHLMPVPFDQIKQSFFKRLIKKGVNIISPKREIIGETTIVQPDFHKDSLIIEEKVYKQIIMKSCRSFQEVHTVEKVDFQLENLPTAKATLKIDYRNANNLLHLIKRIQQKINTDFDAYLNLELHSVDIKVLKLVY